MSKIQNLIGILILFMTVISCDTRITADFEITNNSEVFIDSLIIEPNVSNDGKFISLNPHETREYKADMTTVAKVDGSYQITFQMNKEIKSQDFGYYTNGYPIEKLTKIEIEKDTLKFDFVFGNY